MFEYTEDLKIRGVDLFLDSRGCRRRCFVSHAHGDHLGEHESIIGTGATLALVEHRVGPGHATVIEAGRPVSEDDQTLLKVFGAGHILGSAMLHVERAEGTLLYTGDFKLRASLTVPTAQPMKADVLVMESTYGQPFFRFPSADQVAGQLIELVRAAMREGRQPIVLGYSLGKAQEIVRILTDAGLVVSCHGAVWGMNQFYERFGVVLGKTRRYRFEDFHGPTALDLAERGVLVAPPQVARTNFVNRFENPLRIMMSGWGMLKNAQYRYGVDHVLPLSDHADFDELLELVERVEPKKIYTHHGFREFAEILRSRGHDATPAQPDRQLSLFGD